MRRLPVYLLLDTSGSMMGEPIEAVKNGVEILVSSLRQDPYALETAHLSIISFDTNAKQIVPLTEIAMFNSPQLQATGTTQLGEALALLAEKIEQEVRSRSRICPKRRDTRHPWPHRRQRRWWQQHRLFRALF